MPWTIGMARTLVTPIDTCYLLRLATLVGLEGLLFHEGARLLPSSQSGQEDWKSHHGRCYDCLSAFKK